MHQVMLDFKGWCDLSSVNGAIDCTHIHISKPKEFAKDYYYYKMGGYSAVAQAVVHSRKKIIQLFVGLPSSINDQRMLKRSSLWHQIIHKDLMSTTLGSQDNFPPYFMVDKGYSLLNWMMTLFKEDGQP